MGLGLEIGSKKSESKKDKGKEKDHKSNSEPSNEVTLKDLKHTPFPHRLAKASKANLNAEIYDIFK